MIWLLSSRRRLHSVQLAIALLCVLPLTTSCTNPDLKAEKAVWTRYTEQMERVQAAWTECRNKFPQDPKAFNVCGDEHPSQQELELRYAEYLAACQKCALKDRCKYNHSYNYRAFTHPKRAALVMTAEEKAELEESRAKFAVEVAAAGGRDYLFGCER